MRKARREQEGVNSLPPYALPLPKDGSTAVSLRSGDSFQSQKIFEADVSACNAPKPWQLVDGICPEKPAECKSGRAMTCRAKTEPVNSCTVNTRELVGDDHRTARLPTNKQSNEEQHGKEGDEEHAGHQTLKQRRPKLRRNFHSHIKREVPYPVTCNPQSFPGFDGQKHPKP